MMSLLGVSTSMLVGQLVLGLINGSFYALLSLGLAVIFGLLRLVNAAHGAQYMLGAFCALLMVKYFGISYWPALILVPIVVGCGGIVLERLLLRYVYELDHLYGLLLTFSIGAVLEGLMRIKYGTSVLPYPNPIPGAFQFGGFYLPKYRIWVIAMSVIACMATWTAIEKTKLGSYLRAATERPDLVDAFGINVPRMITLTYGLGVALAAVAGVMAAPIYQVSPVMGGNLLIVVFAVVVIGGMGSILGAIISGFSLGVIEGLTKVFWPEASNTVVFVMMAIVLVIRPNGLFGKGEA